ncbi:hypothetical protein B0H68_005114 [Clostridium beijerinckii]|uniref:hypothetical protein n=1 Tax=Clostridium beijerinckii TaxID=1520 RepID=UPI001F4C502F|nr:hypothetical protein [Clostridium beijerinckii]NSB22554.1 hypothetical protein [Clostridium beijerinckii]
MKAKKFKKFHMFWFALLEFYNYRSLFIKPQVGVADQGDFYRIMNVSGLSLLDSDTNNLTL